MVCDVEHGFKRPKESAARIDHPVLTMHGKRRTEYEVIFVTAHDKVTASPLQIPSSPSHFHNIHVIMAETTRPASKTNSIQLALFLTADYVSTKVSPSCLSTILTWFS